MSKKKEDFLTVYQVADIFSVSIRTIYKAIHQGKIQAFKPGYGKRSCWRICRTEIDRMREFDSRKIIDKIIEKEVEKRLNKS
jgi:excisionase family DNA binding protein